LTGGNDLTENEEEKKKYVQKRHHRSRAPGWNETNLQRKFREARERRLAEEEGVGNDDTRNV
jgi:hypothetical protein